MKPYMLKYSNIYKIGLCIFLTIGCNLSIEGHFWPDNILPYVFLVLSSFVMSQMNWDKLMEWFRQNKVRAVCALIILFGILAQAILLRIYLVDSITVLIKAGIKVLAAGISTAVILILSLFTVSEKKEIAGIPYILFSLLGIVYFYLLRQMTDGFSLYPFLLFLLIYLSEESIKAIKSIESKRNIVTKAGAIVLALFEVLGYLALSYWNYHGGLWKWLGLAAVGTAVWAFIFYYVLIALFVLFDNISLYSENRNYIEDGVKDNKANKKIIAILAIMLGSRCLFWFNWFPALLSKDTYVQIQQALGNESYSNHHPWLHTMIIKFFLNIGKVLFGSNQAGVAVTAFASFFFSSILLLLVLKYYNNNVSSGIWWFAAVIFAIEPIHCVYSVTIWKDVLFAYALLAFCFILMVMEVQIKRQGRLKPYMWLLYVVVSFVFCFSRTNGLYAWIFTLPFLLWHYRKKLKPWIVSTVICILLIIGYKGWMLPHFQVIEPDTVEALSVPLQQIAFTIQNDGDFSEYDTNVINKIANMDSIGEHYNAHISDPVKNFIRNYGHQEYITQNKTEFIKLYISVGMKNPTDYIVAFLNQSRGYWYHKMSNYIYFSEGVHRFAEEIGVYRTPLFPESISAAMDKLMNKYCDVWHMIWSLALSTYAVFILFVYSICKKRACFYFIPIIGVFITLVIATPVNDEFRYAYGIYLALPLLMLQITSQTQASE